MSADNQIYRQPTTSASVLADEVTIETKRDEPAISDESQQDSLPCTKGEAGSTVTVINCLCNVIGGGILTLPSAFAQSSIVIGLILLILLIAIALVTLYFIVECAEQKRLFEYRKLIDSSLGKKMTFFVNLSLVLFPFGALIAYSDIIADIMPSILLRISFFQQHEDSFLLTRICWILISGVVFFLLSCRRSLNELFVSSLFGVLTIFFLLLVVVIRFFVPFNGELVTANSTVETVVSDISIHSSKSSIPWALSWPLTNSASDMQFLRMRKEAEVRGGGEVHSGFKPIYFSYKFLQTIPVIIFSLSLHNNAPTYYQELKERSPSKMYRLFGLSFLIIGLSYATIGVFGVMSFGDQLSSRSISHQNTTLNGTNETNASVTIEEHNGDITTAYSDDDTLVTVARGLLFLHFLCVYPILALATRRGFNNMVFAKSDRDLPKKKLYLESLVITVIAGATAFVVPNIETVVAFNGAIFGTVVVMLAPACIYLSVDPLHKQYIFDHHSRAPVRNRVTSNNSSSSNASQEQEMMEINLMDEATGNTANNDEADPFEGFSHHDFQANSQVTQAHHDAAGGTKLNSDSRKRLILRGTAYSVIIVGIIAGITSVAVTILQLTK